MRFLDEETHSLQFYVSSLLLLAQAASCWAGSKGPLTRITASLQHWHILVFSGACMLGTAVSPTFEEVQLMAALVWLSGLCSATPWLRIL